MVTFSPSVYTRSIFPEGATSPGCCQRLKDLVASILKAVLQFFKTIFPCFFRRTTTPITPQRVVDQQPPAEPLHRLIPQPPLPGGDNRGLGVPPPPPFAGAGGFGGAGAWLLGLAGAAGGRVGAGGGGIGAGGGGAGAGAGMGAGHVAAGGAAQAEVGGAGAAGAAGGPGGVGHAYAGAAGAGPGIGAEAGIGAGAGARAAGAGLGAAGGAGDAEVGPGVEAGAPGPGVGAGVAAGAADAGGGAGAAGPGVGPDGAVDPGAGAGAGMGAGVGAGAAGGAGPEVDEAGGGAGAAGPGVGGDAAGGDGGVGHVDAGVPGGAGVGAGAAAGPGAPVEIDHADVDAPGGAGLGVEVGAAGGAEPGVVGAGFVGGAPDLGVGPDGAGDAGDVAPDIDVVHPGGAGGAGGADGAGDVGPGAGIGAGVVGAGAGAGPDDAAPHGADDALEALFGPLRDALLARNPAAAHVARPADGAGNANLDELDANRAAGDDDDGLPPLHFGGKPVGNGVEDGDEDDLKFDPRTMIFIPRPPNGNAVAPAADVLSDGSEEIDDGHLSDPELDAMFPNPGPRTPKRAPAEVVFRAPTRGDKVWEGTLKFSDLPDTGLGAKMFVILQGISELWPRIAAKQEIDGDLLDHIFGTGNVAFATGHEKNDYVGCDIAINSFDLLELVALDVAKELTSPRFPTNHFGTIEDLTKPPKPSFNSYSRRVEQMAASLQITATKKKQNLIAGILLKGSPKSPEPFGIFAYFNTARVKWDFFFLDCGTDDRPISFHRFPGMGTFRNYVTYRIPAKLEDDENNMFQLIPIALKK